LTGIGNLDSIGAVLIAWLSGKKGVKLFRKQMAFLAVVVATNPRISKMYNNLLFQIYRGFQNCARLESKDSSGFNDY